MPAGAARSGGKLREKRLLPLGKLYSETGILRYFSELCLPSGKGGRIGKWAVDRV